MRKSKKNYELSKHIAPEHLLSAETLPTAQRMHFCRDFYTALGGGYHELPFTDEHPKFISAGAGPSLRAAKAEFEPTLC